MSVRHCALPSCGEPLQQRPTERLSHYLRRRYCNRSCACTGIPRPGLRVPPDTKPCEQCGTAFERRVGSEGPKSWAERRYCCHACSAAARRGTAGPRVSGPRLPRRPRKPTPPPTAAPTTTAAAVVWRPPGWAAQPNTGRRRAS